MSLATDVVVHPLVLLSVADHYNRVASNTQRRVVGVLLGSRTRGAVDITNSFAVPFEEDLKDPSVWFLDHNYLETMFWMFKKVNSAFPPLPFFFAYLERLLTLSLTHRTAPQTLFPPTNRRRRDSGVLQQRA